MKVSIECVEARNLRCPDTKIDFKNKTTGSVINLLQMPNGTGKTTIIELLQGALTGEIINEPWTSAKIKSYKAKDNRVLEGEFKLTISIERPGSHTQKVVFIADFDFEHGSVGFFTIQNEGSGMESGWLPPRDLKQYITKSCAEVFVFKGDKVNDIISPNKNDAEITIKAFFGIENIELFVGQIQDNFKSKIKKSATGSGNTDNEEKLLERWSERRDTLIEKSQKIKNSLTGLKEKRDKLKRKWGEGLKSKSGASTELKEIDKDIVESEKSLSISSSEILEKLRNPLSLSNNLIFGLISMKDSLDTMKLPGASRTFFDELIEEDNGCICGRELDDESIINIQKNIDSYLSNSEINIVNSIKSAILDASKDGDIVGDLKKSFKDLSVLHETCMDAIDAKTQFEERELQDSPDFLDYEDTLDKITKYKIAAINLEKDFSISKLNFSRPDACLSYVAAGKVCDELFDKIGEMSDMFKDVQANKILKDVIISAKDGALVILKKQLKDLTNEKIKSTLPKGAKIEVLEIDKFLQLGWNGVKQDEGSGAQNIIVAYSFARSVLEKASIEFPLIVDHPVTQVDVSNRIALGSALSTMMHQFIGFLIDVERHGFLEGVESGGKVRYISLFSNIEGNSKFIDSVRKINEDETYITDNGYLCYNKSFFIENSMGNNDV